MSLVYPKRRPALKINAQTPYEQISYAISHIHGRLLRAGIELVGSGFEEFLLGANELFFGHAALFDLGLLLFAVLSRFSGKHTPGVLL